MYSRFEPQAREPIDDPARFRYPPPSPTFGEYLNQGHDWFFWRLQCLIAAVDSWFASPGSAPLPVRLSTLRIDLITIFFTNRTDWDFPQPVPSRSPRASRTWSIDLNCPIESGLKQIQNHSVLTLLAPGIFGSPPGEVPASTFTSKLA